MSKNALVGQRVLEVLLDVSGDAIRFVIDRDGVADQITAFADGDCCSHTWIEDVIAPEVLIGEEVLAVEDLDLPDDLCQKTKTDHYEEEMSYYGCAIRTAKGTCTIAYRNSSNGYYGGNLSWPGDYHYGGVFGQNGSGDTWKKIA